MPREQTLRALRDLSNTLQTSIPQQGRGRLATASLLNRQAKDQFQMGRQKKADARQEEIYDLQKPGLELESTKAQGALDRRNTPVDIVNLTGGNLSSMIHMAHVFKGFESEFGGKLDKDSRYIELEGGKKLTIGDLESNPGATERAFRAYTDRKLLAESKLDELGEIRANAKKGQYSPEEIQNFTAQYKKARLYRNNIKQQIADIQSDIDFFIPFNNPKYEKIIEQKEKRIARLEKEYITNLITDSKALTAKTGAKAAAKDTRSNAEKLMDYYAKHITGGDKAKAIEIFRNDKFIEEKLRAYVEELKVMQNGMEWMNLSEKEKAEAIEDLQVRLGIKPKAGAPIAPVGGQKELLTGQENADDPLGIR